MAVRCTASTVNFLFVSLVFLDLSSVFRKCGHVAAFGAGVSTPSRRHFTRKDIHNYLSFSGNNQAYQLRGLFSSLVNQTIDLKDERALNVLLPALEQFENSMIEEAYRVRITLQDHSERLARLEAMLAQRRPPPTAATTTSSNNLSTSPPPVDNLDVPFSDSSNVSSALKVKNPRKKKGKRFEKHAKTSRRGDVAVTEMYINNDDANNNIDGNNYDTTRSKTKKDAESINMSLKGSNDGTDITIFVYTNKTDATINETDITVNETDVTVNKTDVTLNAKENETETETSVNKTDTIIKKTDAEIKKIDTKVKITDTKFKKPDTKFKKPDTKFKKVDAKLSKSDNAIKKTDTIANKTDTTSKKDTPVVVKKIKRINLKKYRKISSKSNTTTEAPPEVDLIQSLKMKIQELELFKKKSAQIQIKSDVKVKQLEKSMGRLRGRFRKLRSRITIQSNKITNLEGANSQRELGPDWYGSHYASYLTDQYNKMDGRVDNLRDLVVRSREEIRELKQVTEKHEQYIRELQSGSNAQEHQLREMMARMVSIEQTVRNVYNSVDSHMTALRWEVQVMLDNVCSNNNLHC